MNSRFWHRQVTLHVFNLLEMIRHVSCEHNIDNEASELPEKRTGRLKKKSAHLWKMSAEGEKHDAIHRL